MRRRVGAARVAVSAGLIQTRGCEPELIGYHLLSECRGPSTPAELAARIVPGYRITPAASLISDELRHAIKEPDGRTIITMPPREGKSTTVGVIGTLEALRHKPDARVILASYADSLAQEHSGAARATVAEHADLLGFRLCPDKTALGRWKVDGRSGGLLAAGILSGITGFGADLLILDDVTKNAQEADSPTYRRRVLHEFRSTLLTRLHPGASVVIIGTRWHPDDLIGTLLTDERERWRYINIPAVAETGIPDALGRDPGVAMISAVGRTPEHFTDLRRSVGERTWYAGFRVSQRRLRATSSGVSGWTPGDCRQRPCRRCSPSLASTRPTAARAMRAASSRRV